MRLYNKERTIMLLQRILLAALITVMFLVSTAPVSAQISNVNIVFIDDQPITPNCRQQLMSWVILHMYVQEGCGLDVERGFRLVATDLDLPAFPSLLVKTSLEILFLTMRIVLPS